MCYLHKSNDCHQLSKTLLCTRMSTHVKVKMSVCACNYIFVVNYNLCYMMWSSPWFDLRRHSIFIMIWSSLWLFDLIFIIMKILSSSRFDLHYDYLIWSLSLWTFDLHHEENLIFIWFQCVQMKILEMVWAIIEIPYFKPISGLIRHMTDHLCRV